VAEDQDKKVKPVRFDFPAGAAADEIAKALTEARKRLMAEYAAKQGKEQEQAKKD
jgi:hypothetical protein